ncbi:MAG: dihydrolipoamide acetyltransferase family protein [Bacteroidota bacterium]
MAQFEVIMPKMGESIEEATITNWFVKEGDKVVEDDVLLEIATDKVDSEIPSPVEGVIQKIMYEQDETVAVGSVIAIIDLDGDGKDKESSAEESETAAPEKPAEETKASEEEETQAPPETPESKLLKSGAEGRFYSPVVRKIAAEEKVSEEELLRIDGSGLNGRVQKRDILEYLEERKEGASAEKPVQKEKEQEEIRASAPSERAAKEEKPKTAASVSAEDEIVEMSRMRKIIADHMIHSKKTSAHVTNMLEVDVTDVVNWRNRIKAEFMKKEGVKITYLPVFLEAAVKAIKDYPMINSSVDGDKIIIKKRINLGIAVALPDYNLIVPVIKDADNYNLAGLTKELNRVANDARNNKLKPDDIQGGTFTVTNFGSFKNTIGTPIINQPQVAILAVGAIEKKPAVVETPQGDMIGIRHKMFLSLTYDHRIIDGALGGAYLRKIADYIEEFDTNRTV